MIFPVKILLPLIVILFSFGVVKTTTDKSNPGIEKKDTVTFIQKTLYPITHPPKLFKK